MKIFLSLVVMCFALHSGMGAPTGTYMYVKCHPFGPNSNCMTYQTQEINITPDQPTKLPADAARDLPAQLVTADSFEEETSMFSTAEEGEGSSGGSSGFEGSADYPFQADASGDNGTPQEGDLKAEYQPAEDELRLDHLLNP